ncbi:DUF4465 domain-containing protein [Methyloversatilis thermotolerans]|uniref:DUF4465 domain-containing protein n=1 Tax=Methyloversatilis thermotolerans TaxID=1346290 RepID=UPI000366FE02|nr:DUF4465 domain-containing protein [Methyloversatilis thermotolerans]
MNTFVRSVLVTGLSMLAGQAHAVTVTFDELPLAAESHYFPEVATTFRSGPASFNFNYTEWYPGCCHSGWVYSNRTDTTTAGYLNQHSAFAGSGADGSASYAIAYYSLSGDPAPVITFDSAVVVASAAFTNTTYAALSMLDGDGFAKKFGGASGNDEDWFKLTVTGWNGTARTGALDIYLADYRFADNSLDYILSDWTTFDLSALGSVTALDFALSSSDTGDWGMNTPAYFALDSLSVSTVPEPAQAALLLAGLSLVGAASRRRPG